MLTSAEVTVVVQLALRASTVKYCQAAEAEARMPSLFDLDEVVA